MIDRAEVRRIAALAHLALSDEEETRLSGELSKILEYVEQLRELPTSDVAPTTAVALSGAFREDEVRPSLAPERALRNAPSVVGSAVAVPKILD